MKNINKILITLRVLFSSTHWLLKIAFLSLPITFFVGINGYLLSNKVIDGYKNHLYESYIGLNGRLSLASNDQIFLEAVQIKAKSMQISSSKKDELKMQVIFSSKEQKIIKYAKWVVLDKEYLETKFNNKIKENDIFVNDIFAKSFGNMQINSFTQLINEDKVIFDISHITIVDTGFLSSEPIIFISFDFAKKLFAGMNIKSRGVEFMLSDDTKILNLKQTIGTEAKTLQVGEFTINDMIADTKETEEFFSKIKAIQLIVLLIVSLLSFVVIVLGIVLLAKFKQNSLSILKLLGISTHDIAVTFAFTVFASGFIVMILSIITISGLEGFLANLFELHSQNSFGLEFKDIQEMFLMIVFVSFSSYAGLRVIFRR